MIVIRLARAGKPTKAFFRIVAIDSKKKLSGMSLAKIGTWHPIKNSINIDKKKLAFWISRGASPTKSVLKLI